MFIFIQLESETFTIYDYWFNQVCNFEYLFIFTQLKSVTLIVDDYLFKSETLLFINFFELSL